MKTKDHTKEEISDCEILEKVSGADLSEKKLLRVFAVDQVFESVDFSRGVLDNCYFRNCIFLGCIFVGSQIKNCNFRGAQFEGCKFIYSEWERTYLEDDFLEKCLPSEENLARDLARTLRVNFAEIGNYEAVNKAAAIEVELAGKHLYNAAFSSQSYYRRKYKGWDRVKQAYAYSKWKLLDLLWGNGESLVKVLLFGFSLVLVAAAAHSQISSFPFSASILIIFEQILGIDNGQPVGRFIKISLVLGQFIFFGLFMAILVKRLSRR